MFIEFFYHLRERGLPVSTTEYLTLLEALEKGLHQDSLDHFYGLARSILVKKPEQYDVYDLAFAEFFKDATVDWSKFRDDLPDELLDWLKDPKAMRALTPEELAAPSAGPRYAPRFCCASPRAVASFANVHVPTT